MAAAHDGAEAGRGRPGRETADPSDRFRYPMADRGLALAPGIYGQIVSWALDGLPNEACGLIAGRVGADGARRVELTYPVRNRDASPEHFSMDPAEQLAAIRDMRARGLVPLGNWHSHPSTPSRPSDEDVRLAYDPQASYLILSFAGVRPRLRSFHVEDGGISEEELSIEDGADGRREGIW